MGTTTTNYSLNKPTVGGDDDAWGTSLNTSMDLIDTQMKANADAAATAQAAADASVQDSDIGVTVQAYDADTAKTDVAQTYTAKPTFGAGIDVTGTVTAYGVISHASTSHAVDAAVVDYSANTSRFVAGRAGGNYGTWQALVAGASGVTNRFQIDYDSTMRWYAADGTTEHMRKDSNGNVGIGTSSPTAALDIVGTDATEQFRVGNTTGGTDFGITVTENDKVVLNAAEGATARNLVLATGGTERARIDSSGNLIVGNSTSRGLSQKTVAGKFLSAQGSLASSVETCAAGSGTFTTITITVALSDSVPSIIGDIQMTGYSGKYLDYCFGKYSSQATAVMRNNSDAGTSVAVTGQIGSSNTLAITITTSVTHPVVNVKFTGGRTGGVFSSDPSISFS